MLKNNNKTSVLVDLLPALSGYAGIPQESRLLFKTLASDPTAETAGFIYANDRRALEHHLNFEQHNKESIVACAHFLNDLMEPTSHSKTGRLAKFKLSLHNLKSVYHLVRKRQFGLKEIDNVQFYDFIWRVFFAKTLLHDDFDLLRHKRYFISQLNLQSMRLANITNRPVTLNTKGWDYILFQNQRPVTVSQGTTKIVRYHDSIPLHDMDLAVPGSQGSHGSDLLRCAQDSFYVCNSEPTREELIRIAPELESKSTTIAPIVASYNKKLNRAHLLNVIAKSFVTVSHNEIEQERILQQLKAEPDFPYILILGTLEPRKNHITLIRAWEQVRAENQSDIRLIIAGSPGWHYQAALNAMRPHTKTGAILHIEKILPEDMGYLYSHAKVFAFPSYNEGFGCPPLEAMQCECPVIASDIPTHRWVYNEAALYCNPYALQAWADGLSALLFSADAKALQANLISKGKQCLEAYTQKKIGAAWSHLFARLKQDNQI